MEKTLFLTSEEKGEGKETEYPAEEVWLPEGGQLVQRPQLAVKILNLELLVDTRQMHVVE